MPQAFSTFFEAAFTNNVVLMLFLGLCPFLGVSKSKSSASGMGIATTLVLVLATVLGWMMEEWILIPYGLGHLRIIGFILVIAAVVQVLELGLKRYAASVHSALGIYLPLITTNCAVLGTALINSSEKAGFVTSVIRGAGSGVGFALAILVFAGLRERLDRADLPIAFRGAPIALLTAGLLSMTVMGFAGLGR